MRLAVAGVVVAVAGFVAACAAISGIDQFKEGSCSGPTCDTGAGTGSSGTSSMAGMTGSSGGGTGASGTSGSSGASSGSETGDGGCTNDCAPSGSQACVDYLTDNANCGACGAACGDGGTCTNGVCTGGAGSPDASVPCPDGGCPSSVATKYACAFGSCNGPTSQCTSPSGCFCSNDNQCLSGKCVQEQGENDLSCTGCTGSGRRDGFNCELASPGIPVPAGAGYACPSGSGYKSSTLSCDPNHQNCYCSADSECPSGKCVPSQNNNSCSGAGPCSGSGTADYRGCQPVATLGSCFTYIAGCTSGQTCSWPTCYCTTDSACESGHCIPSSQNNNCKGCTGPSGATDDGHGCVPPPASIPCGSAGGSACTTSLQPAPVLKSDQSACLCVADSDCSSGKCVNSDSQCSGTCTGASPADSEDCRTATAREIAWTCPIGNCNTVTSPTGSCTASSVPCWCTSDSQCPSKCANWAGCTAGACTGTGTGNAFHCVE